MATLREGQYPVRAHGRGVTFFSFEFVTVDGADPTTTEDPGKAVKTFARDAEGSWKITLNDRYSRIHAVANLADAGDTKVKVDVVTDGLSADNTLEITAISGATADDVAAKRITVLCMAYDN